MRSFLFVASAVVALLAGIDNAALRSVRANTYAIAAFHAPACFVRAGLLVASRQRALFGRLYMQGGSRTYVSRGVGTTGSIRFLCRPELAIITLVPVSRGS